MKIFSFFYLKAFSFVLYIILQREIFFEKLIRGTTEMLERLEELLGKNSIRELRVITRETISVFTSMKIDRDLLKEVIRKISPEFGITEWYVDSQFILIK